MIQKQVSHVSCSNLPKRWVHACHNTGILQPLPGVFVEASEQFDKAQRELPEGPNLVDPQLKILVNVMHEAVVSADKNLEVLQFEQVGIFTAVEASRLLAPMETWN